MSKEEYEKTNEQKAYGICMLLHPATIMGVSCFADGTRTKEEVYMDYINLADKMVKEEVPCSIPKGMTKQHYLSRLKEIIN